MKSIQTYKQAIQYLKLFKMLLDELLFMSICWVFDSRDTCYVKAEGISFCAEELRLAGLISLLLKFFLLSQFSLSPVSQGK